MLTLTGRRVGEVPVEEASAGALRWAELARGRQSLGQLLGSFVLEMGCRDEEGQVLLLSCPLKN